MLRRFIEDQSGATAVEYGLIAVLVSLAAIFGISALSGGIQFLFSDNNSRRVEAFSAP
jgi:pilus assembly protein Flp/PilA